MRECEAGATGCAALRVLDDGSFHWCDQGIKWSVVTYVLGLGLIYSGLS